MIDFISTTKHFECKDKPYLGYLQLEAEYSSGWQKFYLEGCSKMVVWYNSQNNLLRLEGSVMYFVQGHNFSFDKRLFNEGINHIANILRFPLWDSVLNAFEYGVIVEVDGKPKDYIRNHKSKPKEKLVMNEKPKDRGNFRWWEDKNVALKMYDAGVNIKQKQSTEMMQRLMAEGWNPECYYLKWEAHYLRPHISLNMGKGLFLADLVSPQWERTFREDLYIQYQRLVPMKSLMMPTSKKDLSTADIIILELVEAGLNSGKSIEEIKKILYDRINSIPQSIFNAYDKKERKKQVRGLLNKIRENPESKWDLSKKLEEALSESSLLDSEKDNNSYPQFQM